MSLPSKDDDSEDLQAGRCARLRLRGPDGNLGLWSLDLTTGEDPKADYHARVHTRKLLGNSMASHNTTLSIVTGDWNYMVHRNDRWGCTGQSWTGDKDHQGAEEADEHTFHPHNLHELYPEIIHTFPPTPHLGSTVFTATTTSPTSLTTNLAARPSQEERMCPHMQPFPTTDNVHHYIITPTNKSTHYQVSTNHLQRHYQPPQLAPAWCSRTQPTHYHHGGHP